MTKKDYVKFAEMLNTALILSIPTNADSTVKSIIYNTAFIFAADNPNFDRDRFLKACGVES